MANTKVPIELSSTPGIIDNSTATAITIDSAGAATFSGAVSLNGAAQSDSITNTLYMQNLAGTRAANIQLDASGGVSIFDYNGSAWNKSLTLEGGAATFSGDIDAGTRVSSSSAGGTRFDLTSADTQCSLIANYFTTAVPLVFYTSALERMRLDTSGALVLNNAGGDAQMYFGGTGGTNRMYLARSGGDALLWNVDSGAMRFATNNAEVMRISGSSLLVGTTSPSAGIPLTAYYSPTSQMNLGGAGNIVSNNTYFNGTAWVNRNSAVGGAVLQLNTNGSFAFRRAGTGASPTLNYSASIDASGNLLVGTTSLSAAATTAKLQVDSEILSVGSAAGLFWTNRSGSVSSSTNWAGWYSTSANHFLYSNGANRASIGITSGTYTALSDANKKKDLEDSTVGLDAVMKLKPKTYRMLEDADDAPKYLGFIAQDVEHIIPEAYVESTSVDAGGMESTFIGLTDRPFIAALVKAMQEQQAIIEALTARLEALEGA